MSIRRHRPVAAAAPAPAAAHSPVIVGGAINCCLCRNGVKASPAIICDYCDTEFHLACLKMPAIPATARWFCNSCKATPESGAWSLTAFETSTGSEQQERRKSKEIAKQQKRAAEEERAKRAAQAIDIEKEIAGEEASAAPAAIARVDTEGKVAEQDRELEADLRRHQKATASSHQRSARKRKPLHYNEDEPSDVDEVLAEARNPSEPAVATQNRPSGEHEEKGDQDEIGDEDEEAEDEANEPAASSSKHPRRSPVIDLDTLHVSLDADDQPVVPPTKRKRSTPAGDPHSEAEEQEQPTRRTRRTTGAAATSASAGQQYKLLLQMAEQNAALIGSARGASQSPPAEVSATGDSLRERMRRARKDRVTPMADAIEVEEDPLPADKEAPTRRSKSKRKSDPATPATVDSDDDEIIIPTKKSKSSKPRKSATEDAEDASMESPAATPKAKKRERVKSDAPPASSHDAPPTPKIKGLAQPTSLTVVLPPSPKSDFPARSLLHHEPLAPSLLLAKPAPSAIESSSLKAQAAALRAKAQAEREQKAKELAKRLEHMKKGDGAKGAAATAAVPAVKDTPSQSTISGVAASAPSTTRSSVAPSSVKTPAERLAVAAASGRQKLMDLLRQYPDGAALEARMVDQPKKPTAEEPTGTEVEEGKEAAPAKQVTALAALVESIDHLLAKKSDYISEFRLLLMRLGNNPEIAKNLVSGALAPATLISMKAAAFDTAVEKARKAALQRDDMQQHVKAVVEPLVKNPLASITESQVEALGLLHGREPSPEVEVDGPPALEFQSSVTSHLSQLGFPGSMRGQGSVGSKSDAIVIDEDDDDEPMDLREDTPPPAADESISSLPSMRHFEEESTMRDVAPPAVAEVDSIHAGSELGERARMTKPMAKSTVALSKEQLDVASRYMASKQPDSRKPFTPSILPKSIVAAVPIALPSSSLTPTASSSAVPSLSCADANTLWQGSFKFGEGNIWLKCHRIGTSHEERIAQMPNPTFIELRLSTAATLAVFAKARFGTKSMLTMCRLDPRFPDKKGLTPHPLLKCVDFHTGRDRVAVIRHWLSDDQLWQHDGHIVRPMAGSTLNADEINKLFAPSEEPARDGCYYLCVVITAKKPTAKGPSSASPAKATPAPVEAVPPTASPLVTVASSTSSVSSYTPAPAVAPQPILPPQQPFRFEHLAQSMAQTPLFRQQPVESMPFSPQPAAPTLLHPQHPPVQSMLVSPPFQGRSSAYLQANYTHDGSQAPPLAVPNPAYPTGSPPMQPHAPSPYAPPRQDVYGVPPPQPHMQSTYAAPRAMYEEHPAQSASFPPAPYNPQQEYDRAGYVASDRDRYGSSDASRVDYSREREHHRRLESSQRDHPSREYGRHASRTDDRSERESYRRRRSRSRSPSRSDRSREPDRERDRDRGASYEREAYGAPHHSRPRDSDYPSSANATPLGQRNAPPLAFSSQPPSSSYGNDRRGESHYNSRPRWADSRR